MYFNGVKKQTTTKGKKIQNVLEVETRLDSTDMKGKRSK